jgi:hypothetical protein
MYIYKNLNNILIVTHYRLIQIKNIKAIFEDEELIKSKI